MDKSNSDIIKQRRGPVTGTPVLVRIQPELLAKLDEYQTEQAIVSRPEAVRVILQKVLGK